VRLVERLQELERQAVAVAKAPHDHPLRAAALVELQRRCRRLGLPGGRPEVVAGQARAALVAEAERLQQELEREPGVEERRLSPEAEAAAKAWRARWRSRQGP